MWPCIMDAKLPYLVCAQMLLSSLSKCVKSPYFLVGSSLLEGKAAIDGRGVIRIGRLFSNFILLQGLHSAGCIVYDAYWMEYKSKGYVFDSEVTAWLDRLRELHGSYNKGLRLVAFPAEGRGVSAIDVRATNTVKLLGPSDMPSNPSPSSIAHLDVISPLASSKQGKAGVES